MVCLPDPEILHLGPLSIRWYGACAAIAAVVSYFLLTRRTKRFNIGEQQVLDIMMVCVLGGVVGARLEYVRRFWSDFFADDFWGIFRVWEGGLVFQGGFILVVLILLIMCHFRKWSIGDIADLTAPVLPIAHAIARIGCLLNGCCFGIPWAHGVQYPATGNTVLSLQIANGYAPPGTTTPLPVVPVQFLESLLCVAIAALIFWMERRKVMHHRRFLVYVLLYSAGRIGLEFLRGDYEPHPGMTPAQWTTLCFVLPVTFAVIGFLTWQRHHSKPAAQESSLQSENPPEAVSAERTPRKKHRK
ncbi:MAG: prolipoprotein diacylglyceryl transferase [Victivallales bacterium]|nr:prolipoprotein diacylglyceryl transferase [Victivallales bacterium]